MSETEKEKNGKKFSDVIKISWVKSSLILGVVIVAIGVIILLIMKHFNLGSSQLFSDTKAFVNEYGLIGIFFATILAGTIIPLGSPALVAAAALLGVPPLPLALVATTGFTIGMIINYALACKLGRPFVMKKLSSEKLEEVSNLWGKWGWIIYTIFGLIPVLPVEFLSLICGLLKTRLDIFLILSFIPRFIVFAILAYFGEYAGAWTGIA